MKARKRSDSLASALSGAATPNGGRRLTEDVSPPEENPCAVMKLTNDLARRPCRIWRLRTRRSPAIRTPTATAVDPERARSLSSTIRKFPQRSRPGIYPLPLATDAWLAQTKQGGSNQPSVPFQMAPSPPIFSFNNANDQCHILLSTRNTLFLCSRLLQKALTRTLCKDADLTIVLDTVLKRPIAWNARIEIVAGRGR